MPQQPNLFSPDPSTTPPQANSAISGGVSDRGPTLDPVRPRRSRPPTSPWLRRTELLVRVIVRLYLGLLIMALPWMRFWSENGLLSYNRASSLISQSGFTRGLVSGLGLLNIIMALQELFFPTPHKDKP